MERRFYITTPIYYVNADPHLGHAYTTIVADVMNRFHLLSGCDAFFLTGTDEHGDKIVSAAEKAGKTPREYADAVSGRFRSLWPKLRINNSRFIRTTDPEHVDAVRRILNRVKENGDIYFSDYSGLYCFGCERFYAERELVEGKCPDHRTAPVLIKEANYFFKMSKYQDWLIEHIRSHPDFIRPERYRNEVLAFLRDPLEDLCISRPKSRLTWGITLPFDPDFVTYVWFDALINYVSALHFPDGDLFREFWPVAQHLIAKDILKPHGIYWPCMLKSAGIPPYRNLNVHGYWNVNEGKMSKSVGNVVKPLSLVDVYGLDAFRYYLLREMVFGLDSEFSEEALVSRFNADLANDLGNLISRTLTMVAKYFKGRVPAPGAETSVDQTLRKGVLELIDRYVELMPELGFHKALMAIWEVLGKLNKYVDATAPWVLAKTDKERLSCVLYHLVESIKIVSVLLWPFMPDAAEKIQQSLGLSRKAEEWKLEDIRQWGGMKMDRVETKAPHLFPRIGSARKEDPEESKKGEKEEKKDREKISIKDFQRMELKIGTILKAEPIPKSKKLLKLLVDAGGERTVVGGFAGHYAPEDLAGKQVVVVANLEPAALMGVESQGMILAAEDASGVHILTPDKDTKPGSIVK